MANKYFVKMDGTVYGPYDAQQMLNLHLLDNVLVTTSGTVGWVPAGKFNFERLAGEELKERLDSAAHGQAQPMQQPQTNAQNFSQPQQANPQQIRQQQPAAPQQPAPQQRVQQPSQQRRFGNESPFPPEIEVAASLGDGWFTIGGKMIITPEQIIFRPHGVNFGDLRERKYEIRDIVAYKKGMFQNLYITFSQGMRIRLVVWNKGKIISELQARCNWLNGR